MNKMKVSGFSLALLLIAAAAQAQVNLTPKYHAFGAVRPGKHYTLKIKVRNTSAKPVTLAALKADCDCTSAKLSQSIVKPKAFVWLNLDYHPGLEDKGFKSLIIRFNAYFVNDQGERTLEAQNFPFTAQIQPFYSLDPAVLSIPFLAYGKEGKAQGKLKVDLAVYPGWRFSKVEADGGTSPAVRVAPLATPGVYSVDMAVTGVWQPGRYQGKAILAGTGKKGENKFEYPYDINIMSAWLAEPRTLDIGALDPDKLGNWKGHTQVRQIQSKPFKIQKFEGMPGWLKCSSQKTLYGDVLIQWEIDKGKLRDKKEREKAVPEQIEIQTDFEPEPVIHLPLIAAWPQGNDKAQATPTPAHPAPTATAKPQPSNVTGKKPEVKK